MATPENNNEHAGGRGEHWHRRIFEGRLPVFAAVTTIAVIIGGIVEIVPMYTVATANAGAELPDPYTPLELAGRDIYVREGCYNCHSQMIRPVYAETLRYGEWSRSIEYTWDRPFQLGSRRIGPDLAREGGVRNNAWHYDHFLDPRSVQAGSIMPAYTWLYRRTVDPDDIAASMRAMQTLGTPYTDDDIANVAALLEAQGQAIVDDLVATGTEGAEWNQEVIALTAYIQRLGTMYPGADGASAAEEAVVEDPAAPADGAAEEATE